MKQLLAAIIALCLLSLPVSAGTVTGTIAAPNTTLPLKNATLTFTLSQSAIVSGSFLTTAGSVSCYTSADGSVVGLPNPLVQPTVTADITSGTVPAGNYDVAISYYDGSSETMVSPVRTVNLSGPGRLIVSAPVLQPANALGYKVYIALTGTGPYLQATVAGWGSSTTSSALSTSTAVQSSNTSVCSLRFNDELIPTQTFYRATVVTTGGNTVPGFPMRWYLYGGAAGTINLSQGYPTTSLTTIYPMPLLASPPGNAAQSVASPLNLNGYYLQAGQLRSTVTTGTAPLSVVSTTVVPSLNVSQLLGGTWAIPGAIGATTPNSGVFTSLAATSLDSTPIGATTPSTGKFTTANVTTGYQVAGVSEIYFVASSDFTTANNTNLQLITGLTWTLPANTALNVPFECSFSYSQATATAAVAFGIQSATISPTNIQAQGTIQTNTTAFTDGNATVTNTTATAVVSATPSAITTIWNARIRGFIENPSNASTNVINVMVSTAAGADAVTVKRGSFCKLF